MRKELDTMSTDIEVIARCEKLLGLSSEDYDKAALAAAYRAAVRKNHPDLAAGDGNTEQRTKMTAAINRAYATLMTHIAETGGTVHPVAQAPDAIVQDIQGDATDGEPSTGANEGPVASQQRKRASESQHSAFIDPNDYVTPEDPQESGPRVEIFPGVYGTVVRTFDVSWLNSLYDNIDVDRTRMNDAEMRAELISSNEYYEKHVMGTSDDYPGQSATIIDMERGNVIHYDPRQLRREILRQHAVNPYTRPRAASNAKKALEASDRYRRRQSITKIAVISMCLVTAALFLTNNVLPAIALAIVTGLEAVYGILSYPLSGTLPGQYEAIDYAHLTNEELQAIPDYLKTHDGKSPLKAHGMFQKVEDDPSIRIPSVYLNGRDA